MFLACFNEDFSPDPLPVICLPRGVIDAVEALTLGIVGGACGIRKFTSPRRSGKKINYGTGSGGSVLILARPARRNFRIIEDWQHLGHRKQRRFTARTVVFRVVR